MADPPAGRPSSINTIGASGAVAALGAVVVFWAVSGRHPGGIVVGALVLVLAAAGVGAGAGVPRSRVRRGAVVGFAVSLVVAGLVIGALVVHARSLGSGGDRQIALDQRIETAWTDGDQIVAVGFDRVLTVDGSDGTTRTGDGVAIGQHAVVRSGAGGVTTVDGDEVVYRDLQGAEVWRAAIEVDDAPAGRIEVAAVDADRRAAVEACVEARCDLIGIDPDGRETWRRPADTADVGRGEVVVDRPRDRDLVAAPSRLVVVDDPGAADADAVEVDLATGDETPLGAAGELAVLGDTVTIARVLAEGTCEVGIIRGDAAEEIVSAPCIGARYGVGVAMGTVVVHRQRAGVLGIDVEAGRAAAIDGTVDQARTALAGDGVQVQEGPDGIELRRFLDDGVVATFDRGWGLVTSGPDAVVLERERESGNPFAPEERREVVVVDPASGQVCTRVRLDVPFIARASALPGCRAVLSPPDGPDLLIG